MTVYQTLSSAEHLIIYRFLDRVGDLYHLNLVEEIVEGGSVQFEEASVRLAELGREMVTATPERAAAIVGEMTRLKEIQEEARHLPSEVRYVPAGGETHTFREDWDAASTDEERRAIVGHAIDRVIVRRGKQGGWTDAAKLARCEFEWMPAGDRIEEMTDEQLGRLALATEAESPRRRA